MAKSNREKIKLVSSAGTGHYYTATKNQKLHPEKLEIEKQLQVNLAGVIQESVFVYSI